MVVDSYGAGTATRSVGFYRNGGNMDTTCANPLFSGCTQGNIIKETGFDGSDYDYADGSTRQAKLVYDGVRHFIYFKIKYGNTWLTAIQAQFNFQHLFGTDIDQVRIGFTASNGDYYYSDTRITNIRYRRAKINAWESKVVEDGRSIGAIFDAKSKPFTFTIDGQDVCGHDRAVAGETIAVRLLHTTDASIQITVPATCNGATGVGICPWTVVNPGSHPANQDAGGLFKVRFLTETSGYHNVELTAGGATAVIGRVFVAE